MGKLFVADPTKNDSRALLNSSKVAAVTDIISNVPRYISATGDSIIVKKIVLSIGEKSFESNDYTVIQLIPQLISESLDIGTSMIHGRDYYVYAVENNDSLSFKISLNSTYPVGYNANNSRKIGGFHYGTYRRTNLNYIPEDNIEWYDGWEANTVEGCVPESSWSTKFRPTCTPEGMVYIGGGVWVDIYQFSDSEISIFGAIPVNGREGENWYTLNEKAMKYGKRLLKYDEWCKAAFGAPAGDADGTYANTADSRRATGSKVNGNVSSVGCVDCVGNLWEYLDEIITKPTGEAVNNQWYDVFTDHETDSLGKVYISNKDAIAAVACGGDYLSGVNAGFRAINISFSPWTNTTCGTRLGCNSL